MVFTSSSSHLAVRALVSTAPPPPPRIAPPTERISLFSSSSFLKPAFISSFEPTMPCTHDTGTSHHEISSRHTVISKTLQSHLISMPSPWQSHDLSSHQYAIAMAIHDLSSHQYAMGAPATSVSRCRPARPTAAAHRASPGSRERTRRAPPAD